MISKRQSYRKSCPEILILEGFVMGAKFPEHRRAKKKHGMIRTIPHDFRTISALFRFFPHYFRTILYYSALFLHC